MRLDRRGARLGLGALALVAAVGAGADLLASDLPLAARVDGRLLLLPCLTRPPALALDDNQTLRRRAEWLVAPPIPYGPLDSRPGGELRALAPPDRLHLLGTDDRGRDVAARLVHGARTALLVAPPAVALALLLGLLVGVGAALSPRADAIAARLVDVGQCFPVLYLLLALQASIGAPSLWEVALAIALVRWPEVARLVRAAAKSAAASPHVEAARAVGASPLRVAAWHVAPFAVAPAVTAAAVGLGQAILLEAGLSFLGCGAPPPTASWGELLAQAQASGLRPWLLYAPVGALALTLGASHVVATALRDSLDPTHPRRMK